MGVLAQTTTLTSENAAISKALGFNRRLQSAGIDCYAEVFGKPMDLNATPVAGMVVDTKVTPVPPLRALTALELEENLYARVDTIDTELSRAISLANTGVNSGVNAVVVNLPEDVVGKLP